MLVAWRVRFALKFLLGSNADGHTFSKPVKMVEPITIKRGLTLGTVNHFLD